MNLDVLPQFQPEGSYRFALNAVIDSLEENDLAISSESGTSSCSLNFPSGKKVIGSTLTETDDLILFLFDPSGDHEIGRYNPNSCIYTTLIEASCLNFSDKHPINALYKIKSGCEPYVYFTDNYNSYKVINLNDVDNYKIDGNYHCPKMDYMRDYFQPCLYLYGGTNNSGILENAGGTLEIGVYYFAVRFSDKFGNYTPWTIFSRPVAIADEPFTYTTNNSTITQYDGGSNNPDSDYYVGKTNKAISLLINGGDDLFDYYQVAAIKRVSDEGAVGEVIICNDSPWIDGSANFIYKGTEAQVKETITLEELLTPTARFSKVNAQAFQENTLYLGNTSGTYRDYTKYQQYASKVKTEWVKSQVSDDVSSRVKQPIYYFQDGSLMEDETYAFGVVFVFSDGTESPVFPLVGRAADSGIPANGYNPYIGSSGVSTDAQPWDTGIASYGDAIAYTRRWGQISTAIQYGTTQAGLPGYHESDVATYPDIPTCTDLTDGYWGRD